MTEIRHRVGTQAPADRVYEAVTTTNGVASWWWQDIRGDAQPKRLLETGPATPFATCTPVSSMSVG
jgi:uncharacterized protein YndB with AHSA1/START domain